MLTPISITALDQGRDLAHWQVRRLYAEVEQQIEAEAPNIIAISVPSRWRRVLNTLLGVARAPHVTRPADTRRRNEAMTSCYPAE